MQLTLRLKPLYNQDPHRIKDEVDRALGFRGHALTVENGFLGCVSVPIEVADCWTMDCKDKLTYLKGWIPAKLRGLELVKITDLKLSDEDVKQAMGQARARRVAAR